MPYCTLDSATPTEINIIDFRYSFRPIALTGLTKSTFQRLQRLHTIQRIYFLVSEKTLEASLHSYANIASTTTHPLVNVKIANLNNSQTIGYRTYSPMMGINKKLETYVAGIESRLSTLILGIDYTASPLSFDALEKNIKSIVKPDASDRLKINWYDSSWKEISTLDETSALLPSTGDIERQPQYLSINDAPQARYSSRTSTCCNTWCACWPWSSRKTIYG